MIIIYFYLGGGFIVFWIYYLSYRSNIVKALVTSLIFGCTHTLLAIVIFTTSYLTDIGYIPRNLPEFLKVVFTIAGAYYFLLAIPISIGSIAITFVFYKKKMITNKVLGLIVLMNIIHIVFAFITQ